MDFRVPMEEIVEHLSPNGKLEFELASVRAMFNRALARISELEAELDGHKADQALRS
jgi:hypothetical protein